MHSIIGWGTKGDFNILYLLWFDDQGLADDPSRWAELFRMWRNRPGLSREDAFTPKSNGINVMRGRGREVVMVGLGEGCRTSWKPSPHSHLNDLEIKEDTTKPDGDDSESVYATAVLPNQCIHLFTCMCRRSRAWKATNALCSLFFFS